MKFHLVPILDKMIEFYNLPRNQERFDIYLNMLQGEKKSEMILSIAGYNPMGNEYVLQRLEKLRALKTEDLVSEALFEVNQKTKLNSNTSFEVVINLIDDLGGAWSERCTTDYTNRFRIAPLVERSFCCPYFWTSESFNEKLIRKRTLEQVYRTIIFHNSGAAKTLGDHVEQELSVLKVIGGDPPNRNIDFEKIHRYYINNLKSDDYTLIFNFMYGDSASEVMGYKLWGNAENTGFDYITMLSSQQK